MSYWCLMRVAVGSDQIRKITSDTQAAGQTPRRLGPAYQCPAPSDILDTHTHPRATSMFKFLISWGCAFHNTRQSCNFCSSSEYKLYFFFPVRGGFISQRVDSALFRRNTLKICICAAIMTFLHSFYWPSRRHWEFLKLYCCRASQLHTRPYSQAKLYYSWAQTMLWHGASPSIMNSIRLPVSLSIKERRGSRESRRKRR